MPTSSCPEAKSLSLSVSSEAWEKVVSFPPDPSQEDDRLENLIVATMLTFKSAGPDRKSIDFGQYCLPPDGSSNVPLTPPLRLTLEDNHLLVLPFISADCLSILHSPCRATPDRERCTRLLYHEITLMNRSNDLYQKVTDEIIATLEKGVIPWVRPWREGEPVVLMNALPSYRCHRINAETGARFVCHAETTRPPRY